MMRRIDESDVGIFCERTLDSRKIGHVFDRRAKVDMGKSIGAAYIDGTRRIRAVVDDEHFLPRRQKRIQAHVHVERARATEEHARKLLRIGMNDLQKPLRHLAHDVAEFFFARANIGHDLCHFHCICRRRRTRI